MATDWVEIQAKAAAFAEEFKDVKEEDKWAKEFWSKLFGVFGVSPRTVGTFEERVKLLRKGHGFIDFFAPGRFLIEHKSKGENLAKAFEQATEYFDALKEHQKPRYIVICDFARFQVYDLEAPIEKRCIEFDTKDLGKIKNLTALGFLADDTVVNYEDGAEVDVKAVREVGKLYKALKASNYPKESTSRLLTRLVFCFFADDTGIFDPHSFTRYLSEHTKPDGSDIGAHLSTVFQILDTKESERQTTLSPILASLPYVNGGLFREPIASIFGTEEIRNSILACSHLNWAEISPAIFGSMFQSVLDEDERHQLGAHYTSETNILKVIEPLFLDELRERFNESKSEEKLREFWADVARITLLDPACGCGNFLVIAYRELRLLELDIIKRLDDKKGERSAAAASHSTLGMEVDMKTISKLSVERMYGIEIESFPAEVAKLSLWLMDHMMNVKLGSYYGKPFKKLPLTEAPHIVCANALTTDWESVVPKEKLTYILGNPPFLGQTYQKDIQKENMKIVFSGVKNYGVLDFVSAWYMKAADIIQTNDNISAAFVSTNSITQGEQVSVLWHELLAKGVHIFFAHRTFKWTNEAQGRAAVHCVIIGISKRNNRKKRLYSYLGDNKVVIENVKNINPYLVSAPDILVTSRTKKLSESPEMLWGNKPVDGGNLILDQVEKETLVAQEPECEQFIKRLMGAREFLQGEIRYCLWLVGASPSVLNKMPLVLKRIEAVKATRLLSVDVGAQKLAERPTEFRDIQNPRSFILIPSTSSENRRYVPFGFFDDNYIATNATHIIPNGTLYHFGVLESEMHMAWMRAVCGRLESRYRYSKDIVYNNFSWPEDATEAEKKKVEECAQTVLDARAAHPEATLADLYNPLTMPKNLLDAHKALDKAVDSCYHRTFKTEPERLEFLFERYQVLAAVADAKVKVRKSKEK